MSFSSEYLKLRQKRIEEEKAKMEGGSFSEKYTALRNERLATRYNSNDIAPITTTAKEKEDKKWFQSGAFSDGYQFGDLTKTITATTEDLLGDVAGGMSNIFEGVIDVGAYAIGGIGGLLGADEFQAKTQEFIAKDIINEEKVGNVVGNILMGDIFFDTDAEAKEKNSIFGQKTDSLAQSAGQLVDTVALQAVGVPWWVTTGVMSAGGEVDEAFNEGATYGEAGLSALVSAGATMLTEKIFSGIKFGGKTVEDAWIQPLINKISSKTVRTLANVGLDMAGEGAEEVLEGFMSAIGKKLTYADDKELNEIFSSEEALDSFIGGAVLGGVMGGGRAVGSIKSGRDYKTGLTTNEQTVVDKVYNDRVAEAEKSGKKLSSKEKAVIKEQVLEDLKKGAISTDTIESVLGGDTYKSYQDTIANEDSILREFEELGKKTNPTLADQSRYAELKEQVKEIKENSKRDSLKTQLSEEVQKQLVRNNGKYTQADNYLIESYNERANRGKAFEADLSKYDEKQVEIIKRAVDGKILNNTRRTHELVDMIAKISADKGVLFDFTNNQKLKESGFAIDGKSVNGYITKDGITVNIDSGKYLNSVVGHEITHVLEGTEIYTELQNALFEYAKTKGDYQGRFDTLSELYKDVEGADVNAELTADLVGDYLFTDSDFVNSLSTKHRNVFQKIYDEIKYLCKVVTAGSKEARELEKVKKAFDKAYKESGTAKGDTKYSLIGKTTDGIEIYETSQDVINLTWNERKAKYLDVMKNEYIGRTAKFTRNGHTYYAEFDQNSLRKPIYGDKRSSPNGTKALIKAGADGDIFDLVENSEYRRSRPNTKDHTDADYFDYFVKTVQIDGKVFDLVADVEKKYGVDGGYVYTLALTDNKKIKASPTHGLDPVKNVGNASTVIISQNPEKSIGNEKNPKYSLSDSDGKKLTKEQNEYFKDSKMRDENGNLKVMYHGSQDAGFHEFNSRFSDDDTSFFFVDRNDVAASYSGTSETYVAQTIRTADDMNNFIESIGVEGYEVVENDGKFTLLYEGDRVAASNTAQGIYDEFCWYEGVGEGDANYKVYLNLTNPLEIDAKGRPWNKIDAEFSQDVYDKYQSLTAEEKAALTDLAEWEDFRVFNSEIQEARDNELASAYAKMGEDINIYDLFSVAADNFSEESMRENSRYYLKTRDFAQRAKEGGYDGVIFKNIVDNGGYSNGDEGASTVAIAFDSNQIKSVGNNKPTSHPDIRYSLSEADNSYLEAVERGDTETAQEIVESVAKQSGYSIRAYHGTRRGDRVGNVFLPERATSGPMAFFTDNKDIAENYAKSKQDTSMAYDPDFDRYETQFRIKTKYNDLPLYQAWRYLPLDAKNRITEKAGQLHENWDGDYELILDSDTNEANGGFQWQLKEARGNAIQALTEQWLNSGTLFNEESRFLDVLEMTGVTEEFKKIGMDSLYFKDPDARHEKVYDTFLKITNPFDTANVNEKFADDLASWYEEQDQSKYVRETADSDLWDKNNIDAYDFVDRVRRDIENGTAHAWTSIPDSVTDYLKYLGYDGIKDTGGKNGGIGHTVWIPFSSEQIKSAEPITYDDNGKVIPLSERFNSENVDIRYSLSAEGETPKPYGNFNISGEDVRLETAPIREDIAKNATTTQEDIPTVAEAVDETVTNANIPVLTEEETTALMGDEPTLYDLETELTSIEEQISKAVDSKDAETVNRLLPQYTDLQKKIKQMQTENSERISSLDEADIPPEAEAPYYGEEEAVMPESPFEDRDIKEVGNRKVKAYMYENPEVKPFFQEEAAVMLGELENTTKGERIYIETPDGRPGEYGLDSYGFWTGTTRHTTPEIAYLLDNLKYSYAEIEKGLKAIIEDNGAENNACSKRIEFLLNDRLMNGYMDNDFGYEVPPNQDYIKLLNEKQITEYTEEARKKFYEVADDYAPYVEGEQKTVKATAEPTANEDIAPLFDTKSKDQIEGQQTLFEDPEAEAEPPKVAKVLTSEPDAKKKKRSIFTRAMTNLADKGFVFENLAKETKNRNLESKYNFMHYSEARAQEYIADHLKPIVDKVEKLGKTEQLYEYVYHLHNVDRMSLETEENRVKRETLREQFKGYSDKQIEAIAREWIKRNTPEDAANRIRNAREYIKTLKGRNKPVFGDSVTADISRETVKKLEAENPELKDLSTALIDYNTQLRKMLVDGNVISQETGDLWAKMYPHYVPIRRLGDEGLSVNVPLDTNKTGVNAPIKRATGGNRDILPLFDTMAMRTEQTFKAVAKNSFGTELMHTLDSVVENEITDLDEVIDSFDNHDELLKKGENGKNPTFTVFEDGKRVTFEITEDMYDALKPTSEGLRYTNKVANTAGNIFRGLLTEYNPVFMATNAVKDAQDILINSQHAAKTYANIPNAIKEIASKGRWYTEYMKNGGSQNTYFDNETNTFKKENNGFVKAIGMPLRAISTANNFIERVPRLAEYIASRKAGASVETAMLDAARVSTNFAAGGDVTKALNRNGFTFLNASVQGAMQQVRNVREAKMNGFKGWLQLAAKVAIAGLPAILLNNLIWDDDDEYEELSDYVKQNYYVVAKFGDGKFVRIPKGRTVAVIQEAFMQMNNLATGNDEVDLESFAELVISNLAPNNPLENNILAPFIQVANNETWYGEDLVPTRLQDLPIAEQYDESTDAISRWLGENVPFFSPYQWNYLLNQYSGGVGDVFLPMITPEAESGDNSLAGNILAPFKDKFTTDSVMNNQNVSDFYDTMDELTKNANSMYATDEDVLKYKYFNSINADLSELYEQKREIQNSSLDDDIKYDRVRNIQKQIDELTRNSLNTYNSVSINGSYATVGDRHYRWYEPGEDSEAEAGWQKITDKQLEKQQEVTSGLGISPSEYWNNKAEYDYAYDNPEKYAVAKAIGGYSAYKTYSSELYDIKADKDEDGKSISGSRKEKVIEYINNLNADYGEKIILFKSEYNADDTYNNEIIDYLNSREDISYSEMVVILKELGFTVRSDGTVEW